VPREHWYFSVLAWLKGVGSHPLGHDLVFLLEPDTQFCGYVCKTCNLYLVVSLSSARQERFLWPKMQGDPEGLLADLQDRYRDGLTVWERLLFEDSVVD